MWSLSPATIAATCTPHIVLRHGMLLPAGSKRHGAWPSAVAHTCVSHMRCLTVGGWNALKEVWKACTAFGGRWLGPRIPHTHPGRPRHEWGPPPPVRRKTWLVSWASLPCGTEHAVGFTSGPARGAVRASACSAGVSSHRQGRQRAYLHAPVKAATCGSLRGFRSSGICPPPRAWPPRSRKVTAGSGWDTRIVSVGEYAMPAEDWMSVSVRTPGAGGDRPGAAPQVVRRPLGRGGGVPTSVRRSGGVLRQRRLRIQEDHVWASTSGPRRPSSAAEVGHN